MNAHADTVTVPDVDDDQLTAMYARDAEHEPAPFAFGSKFMSGRVVSECVGGMCVTRLQAAPVRACRCWAMDSSSIGSR